MSQHNQLLLNQAVAEESEDSGDAVAFVTEVQRRVEQLRAVRNQHAKDEIELYNQHCDDLATQVKKATDRAEQDRLNRKLELWRKWTDQTEKVYGVREAITNVGKAASNEFVGFTAQLETVLRGIQAEMVAEDVLSPGPVETHDQAGQPGGGM